MRYRDSLITQRDSDRKYFEGEIKKLEDVKKEKDKERLKKLNDEILVLKKQLKEASKSYNEKNIVEQNGVWYKKFSDEVANGNVFKEIGGMEAPLGRLKDGKKEGKWIEWNKNGTRMSEQNFKNGYLFGKSVEYNNDGKIQVETDYKDENNYDVTWYEEDGTIRTKGNMVDGKPNEGTFYGYKQTKVKFIDLHKPTIAYYAKGILERAVYFDKYDLKDTLRIEEYVNGQLTKTIEVAEINELKKEEEKQTKRKDYLDSIKAVLVYDKSQFKLYSKQYNEGSGYRIQFELENNSNVDYSSVWFMFKAIKKESQEPFEKRLQFTDLERKGTRRITLFTMDGAELEDFKLEVTRQRRQ